MNSTLQCLASMKELREALKGAGGRGEGGKEERVAKEARELFERLSSSNEDFLSPFQFLVAFHEAFPQFKEKGEGGGLMQQDAEECWSSLLNAFSLSLPPLPNLPSPSPLSHSPISQLFSGIFKVTLTCQENEKEEATTFEEHFDKLSCPISKDTNFLYQGLEKGLEEVVEKYSPSLSRNALYKKKLTIDFLPLFLTLQFVRFFWKKANESTRKEGVKSKILRPVTYPLRLDLFPFCSPPLQQHITALRKRIRQEADNKLGLLTPLSNNKHNNKDNNENTSSNSSNEVKVEKEEMDITSEGAGGVEEGEGRVGGNETGYYDLKAVLTHKGRSADSGHYVAWVKRKANDWVLFDDKDVRPATDQEVLSLCGKAGGDAHIAYLLLYSSVTPQQLRESTI